MKILVINCGSSSLKYQLMDMNDETTLCKGICERIGMETSIISHTAHGKKNKSNAIFPTHFEALNEVVKRLTTGEEKVIDDLSEVDAIGHRVVHGGESLSEPCLLTPAVEQQIRDICSLAPLHNPPALQGFECAKKVFGENIPNVCVFDTAFHSTMPEKAYMYALPYEYYTDFGVRRYGFHGTSHKYVSRTAAEYIGKPVEDLKIITCHLGNGASVAAIENGKVVDTSMGLTPLAGLMMGTRCGDIDPSVVNFLKYKLDITSHRMDDVLNKKSGLLGISGFSSDKRDVQNAAAEGHPRARLAEDMFNYQVRKTVGSYLSVLGGVDVLVFTGGIGENDEPCREVVCQNMEWCGIEYDHDLNWGVRAKGEDICEINGENSKVKVLVVATNEELMIARETKAIANG